MSWLFSRALVAAYSAVNCSDGEQSAPLNAKCTPHLYLHSDKTTAFWTRFPSGMMCEPLTADRGAALLTWYLAAFPVRTYLSPEREPESPEHEADYGQRWRELSVRYDRNSCSWRTHQCLFTEDLQESSVTLPRWGMMRDGVCWERMMSGRRTRETESGLWQTPTVSCATGGQTCRSGKRKNELLLAGAVKNFPTPKARDWKGQTQRGIHAPGDAIPNMDNGDGKPIGGQLNPTWVEWLMGWPLEWTGLKPLATDRFRQWLHSHGRC